MRILLVEPKSNTSYPPMGLMKISRYHKLLGDEVKYVSGINKKDARQFWDKIYVTSVFTYDYKNLIKTIRLYSGNLFNFDNMIVGGVAATLLADKIGKETGVKVHRGLLNYHDEKLEKIARQLPEYSYLIAAGCSIDNLPPDYSVVNGNSKYSKITDNSFFLYTTKGCPNKCAFCAVKKLEPIYINYIPIKERIQILRDEIGDRPGLLLLDNNIAASNSYFKIINEIGECGYGADEKMAYQKNGRMNYRQRFVDFNQGVDLRLLDKEKMKALATIAIEPLRLAFEDIKLKKEYSEKVFLAISCGIRKISNYLLFNFKDKPEELYRRLLINTDIIKENKIENIKIFSFPMRYSPISQTDRAFIGKYWTKRQVRAVQLILQATHGIVSHSLSQYKNGTGYFYRAFGKDVNEFIANTFMPFHYIINRDKFEYESTEIDDFRLQFYNLNNKERTELINIIRDGKLKSIPRVKGKSLIKILEHYENESSKIIT